jgi:integrase
MAKSTINSVIPAAIASEYKFSPFSSPTSHPLVTATKKTIARLTKPATQKKPITREMILKIVKLPEAKSSFEKFTNTRDIFMTILMMTGLLRASEATNLRSDDLLLTTTVIKGKEVPVLMLYIEKSKTDQERIGKSIMIGEAKSKECCPILWMKKYTTVRNEKSEHMFHAFNSTKKLSKSTPNSRIKSLLQKIGILDSEKYGSHSARRGGATSAASAGIDPRLLSKHGRWKSTCFYIYIDESEENQLSVSQSIL